MTLIDLTVQSLQSRRLDTLPVAGYAKRLCVPPPPVRAVIVSGRAPYSASSSTSDSSPSCLVSTSSTTSPLFEPVAIATFASGHSLHHLVIVSASVVASLRPRGTARPSGCLPLLPQLGAPQAQRPVGSAHQHGNTAHPRLA